MLFVTGLHGTGKTLLASLLAKEGFFSIDLGPTLRAVWKHASLDISFDDFVQAGERKFGRHFTDEILVREIKQTLSSQQPRVNPKRLLIVGSRSVFGIKYIRSHISEINRARTFVVYIEVDKAILCQRYCQRERIQPSIEEFGNLLKRDKEMGIDGIRAIADFVIANNGSLEEFDRSIRNMVFDTLRL